MAAGTPRRVILIVEDTQSIAQLLNDALNEEPTYQAIAVGDGAQALETLESVRVDLLLLDVMLPGMNGIELYERIQEIPTAKDVPVLFLTADPSALRDLHAHGLRNYLSKPFDLDELLNRVGGLLAERR